MGAQRKGSSLYSEGDWAKGVSFMKCVPTLVMFLPQASFLSPIFFHIHPGMYLLDSNFFHARFELFKVPHDSPVYVENQSDMKIAFDERADKNVSRKNAKNKFNPGTSSPDTHSNLN